VPDIKIHPRRIAVQSALAVIERLRM